MYFVLRISGSALLLVILRMNVWYGIWQPTDANFYRNYTRTNNVMHENLICFCYRNRRWWIPKYLPADCNYHKNHHIQRIITSVAVSDSGMRKHLINIFNYGFNENSVCACVLYGFDLLLFAFLHHRSILESSFNNCASSDISRKKIYDVFMLEWTGMICERLISCEKRKKRSKNCKLMRDLVEIFSVGNLKFSVFLSSWQSLLTIILFPISVFKSAYIFLYDCSTEEIPNDMRNYLKLFFWKNKKSDKRQTDITFSFEREKFRKTSKCFTNQ